MREQICNVKESRRKHNPNLTMTTRLLPAREPAAIRLPEAPLLVQKAHDLHKTGLSLFDSLLSLLGLLRSFVLWFVSFCHRTHWSFSLLLVLLALTLVAYALSRPTRKRPPLLTRLRQAAPS